MNHYKVVQFANGKYGVHFRGEYKEREGLFALVGARERWWSSPINVAQYCMMSKRQAMKICKRLNSEYVDMVNAIKQTNKDVVVVKTISCD